MAAILPANAQAIWDALINQGATATQAAGIMGNMQFESGMDPESQGMDTNGAYSRGLVQWNDAGAGRGVNWSQYITGNVPADISAQVSLIRAQGGFAKAAGSDPTAAGQSFATNFEACAECGPGGYQTLARGREATVVYQVAQSGNWGLGSGLAPLGNSGAPADATPSAAPATAVTLSWELPFTPGAIGNDLQQAWKAIGGPVKGAEKAYQAFATLVPLLIAPSTWIRVSEVVLGTILGSAGLAMLAVVVAGEHPDLALTMASLIPGEGQVAAAGAGAARAATSGKVGRTVAGAGQAGRTAPRRPSRAPAPRPAPARAPSLAGAGRTSRRATAAAAGTARRAAPQPERRYRAGEPGYGARGLTRAQIAARNRRSFARMTPDEDDERYEAAKQSGRENRSYYRREMGGRPRPRHSDLRRRTP